MTVVSLVMNGTATGGDLLLTGQEMRIQNAVQRQTLHDEGTRTRKGANKMTLSKLEFLLKMSQCGFHLKGQGPE